MSLCRTTASGGLGRPCCLFAHALYALITHWAAKRLDVITFHRHIHPFHTHKTVETQINPRRRSQQVYKKEHKTNENGIALPEVKLPSTTEVGLGNVLRVDISTAYNNIYRYYLHTQINHQQYSPLPFQTRID